MQDKIVLVTGSTDGIGKVTARQLAQLGATVIVHGRDADRCEATRATISFRIMRVLQYLLGQRRIDQ